MDTPSSRLIPVMSTLVSCLCAQIVADGSPEPCFCGLMPGEVVLADYTSCDDKDGMAWVRLITAYPSVVLGAANTQPGNCAVMLGADLEVGVLRSMPVGGTDGSPPSVEEMNEIAALIATDAESIRRAIMCCNDSLPLIDMMLGAWTPTGPQGGLTGGSWTVGLQVP